MKELFPIIPLPEAVARIAAVNGRSQERAMHYLIGQAEDRFQLLMRTRPKTGSRILKIRQRIAADHDEVLAALDAGADELYALQDTLAARANHMRSLEQVEAELKQVQQSLDNDGKRMSDELFIRQSIRAQRLPERIAELRGLIAPLTERARELLKGDFDTSAVVANMKTHEDPTLIELAKQNRLLIGL